MEENKNTEVRESEQTEEKEAEHMEAGENEDIGEKEAGYTEGEEQELEIREFVHKNREERKERKRIPVKGKAAAKMTSKLHLIKKAAVLHREGLWMAGGALVLLTVVLLGIFLCKMPVAAVLLLALLEAALALCLCRSPIWLHGAALLANVLLGVLFHYTGFMLLASLVYLAGIWVLHHSKKDVFEALERKRNGNGA